MDLALSEVLAQLSDRGRIEWQLAVERARNARLAAML